MTSFERACAETERAARAALAASNSQVKAAKELAKAAAEGDIARIGKASERLRTVGDAARQEIANAARAWPLSPEEEEALLAGSYEQELVDAARSAGIEIRRHDQRLLAFPLVLRLLPAQRAVQVDKKKLTGIRPSNLVAILKREQAKKPRLSPERFLETLYSAYRLVVGEEPGSGTQLARVYEALTLMPEMRREYGSADFVRDIFLLDHSGVTTTKSGARVSFPASTGTKGGRDVFTFVDESGSSVTYYGIRFS